MSDEMMLNDKAAAGGRSGWKQDPAGVRKNILEVAMAEFAANGLSGARIDEIAAKTRYIEADDLLLFRRQGGPLPPRPGGSLSAGARRASRSSSSTICRRSRR